MNCSLIQVLQGLLTPVIAAIAVMIALFQWRTAQQKMALDLFDRRMETYSALRTIIGKVMASSSAATHEAGFEFLQALDRARFLFGAEIVEQLNKIYGAIEDIRVAVAEREHLGLGPERNANVATERAARNVVTGFYVNVDLSSYMRMDQKLPWKWRARVRGKTEA
jgi:hypothetical protein